MIKDYFTPNIDINDFALLCSQQVNINDYPNAKGIEKKVVIYEGGDLSRAMLSYEINQKLRAELYRCLKDGPGVLVIKGFYEDVSPVNESTQIFQDIIREEKGLRVNAGDHFAAAGQNERIWNSFQKVGERDPVAFISYYKNPLYALLSEAWLGPGYQITAQVNVVKPGGKAQSAHRDYHLGFQSNETVHRFPLSLQVASQYLTLQGAIAHSDMPIETGPTLLLPFSQQYELGYQAWREPVFSGYFSAHAVQLALKKGDAMFFSPALFHAAGTNTQSTDRIANLIQVSAAFGKAMESVDRSKLMKLCYPVLLDQIKNQKITDLEIQSIVAAIADAYSFPTNLDLLPPVGGAAPETAEQLLMRALMERWTYEQFCQTVDQQDQNRKA